MFAWSNPAVGESADPGFMLGGIQINEPDQPAWCKTLREAGFNTLHVTVYARQPQWDSDELLVKPVDEGTIEKIRAARAEGLDVALILRLETDHAYPENRFLWHGLVSPSPDNSGGLDEWFDRYAGLVSQWAEVAEREGVALLGLGSEMNALAATRPITKLPPLARYYLDTGQQSRRRELLLAQADEIPSELIRAPGDAAPVDNLRAFMEAQDQALHDWAAAVTFANDGLTVPQRLEKINARRARLLERWRQMIAEVRGVYSGELTYAANFDNYADVAFWPELDVMGINAYFPLRQPSEPATFETFSTGWTDVFNEIETAQKQLAVTDMPIVFTELGYTRRAGTTTAPWAWQGFEMVGDEKQLTVWETLPFDRHERALAMTALRSAVAVGRRPLVGLLYWKLTSKPYHAELEPFALLIGEHADDDPLHPALLSFLQRPTSFKNSR